MSDTEKHYVELDVLLDTRLGTLAKINSGYPEQMLLSGKYYDRFHDRFDFFIDIDRDAYQREYTHRDLETLKLSKTTLVYKMINNELTESYYRYIQNINDSPPKVVVNTWPYILNKAEQKAMRAVLATILITYDIKLIREDPVKLPPWELAKDYRHLWMYDLDAYLKPHYRGFNKHFCGGAVFHFPAIAQGNFDQTVDEESLVSGFTELQEGLAGVMVLDFIPSFNFSFHLHTTDPKGLEEETDEGIIETEADLAKVAAEERHDLDRDSWQP